MSDEPRVVERHISEYRFDPKNARKHTPRNVGMIGESLQQTGAGRSIVVANDGTIIAGNATVEAAGQAGFERIIEVETDGKTLVAVKRRDLAPDDPRAVMHGLFDNRTAEFAYWDSDRIAELVADDDVDLSSLWYDNELDELLNADDVAPFSPGESPLKGYKNMTFPLTAAQYQIVESALKQRIAIGDGDSPLNPHKPSNALVALVEEALYAGGEPPQDDAA